MKTYKRFFERNSVPNSIEMDKIIEALLNLEKAVVYFEEMVTNLEFVQEELAKLKENYVISSN